LLDEKTPPVTELDRLSAIIAHVNEISNTHFTEEDKVKISRIANTINSNKDFQESLKTNTKSNLKLLFKRLFNTNLADMYESDFNFYKKIEENIELKELLKEHLFEEVFRHGRESNP